MTDLFFTKFNHWLLFYLIVLASWALLFILGDVDTGLKGSYSLLEREFWASICRPSATLADLPKSFVMWSIMSLGMMLPTVVPTLRAYDDLIAGKIGTIVGFYKLVAGFASIWIIFSGILAVLQLLLVRGNLIGLDGVLLNPIFSGTLLIFAAAYQFSPIKEACLSKCRSPMAFFLEYGSQKSSYEFQLGVRIGIYCIGCCWALMLLAFVGGTMNLFFMAIAMLLMTLEKLPDIGRVVTKPIAICLIIFSSIYFFGAIGQYT